jgi:hypothetical protein
MTTPKLILLSLVAIILLFSTFCLITWLLPGIFIYLPGGEQYYPVDPGAKYHEGQIITGYEALRLINISRNDYYVGNIITDIKSRTDANYTIGRVIADRYLEKTPFTSYDLLHPHYYRVLPAIEYIFGGLWDQGINMYAFIDPDKNRVAYIGYMERYGIENGNYTYESDVGGVTLFETYYQRFPIFTFSNATIVDTGYNPSNLSRALEDELIGIALNDSRVSDLLRDHAYIANVSRVSSSSSYSGQDYSYDISYPGVVFSTSDTGNLSFYMYVEIDPLNKTVTYLSQPVT